ncbi:unnamed protein product [Brassica napus]|nr:unnamed protein product [Brassica napus]
MKVTTRGSFPISYEGLRVKQKVRGGVHHQGPNEIGVLGVSGIVKMIKAVMMMNTQGKPRLAKFYDFLPVEKQQELIRGVFSVLSSRPENVSNFLEIDSLFGPDSRLVYKHYATLYFVLVFDGSENELAMLDLIQVLVETLDKCFSNVCELDIVFNYSKMHTVLDEIVFGGQVLETRSDEIMKAVEEISK